jgi:shikimate kinase
MARDEPTLLRAVALSGFMGAGKSTVGPMLAGLLGVGFRDLDRLLESEAGRTVPEIFRLEGEAGFRAREVDLMRRCLTGPPMVWSLGGGAVTTPEGRSVLKQSGVRVVWLQVDWETVAVRVSAEDRPLLAAGADAGALLLVAREPWYRACADITVDGRRPPAEVAQEIRDRLREAGDVD